MICSVCGKTQGKILGASNKYGSPLCEKHYAQFRRLGRFLDNSQRSNRDNNEIIIKDGFAELILYKNNIENARAIIDIEDIQKVSDKKWNTIQNNYVATKINKKVVLLHRLIMDCPNNMEVDHKNRNPLDNRKCNLRICTSQQNSFNTGMFSSNSSGHKGVYFDKSRDKWVAQIMVNEKKIFLGRFIRIEDAIKAREDAEFKYFGMFKNGNEGDSK